MPPRPHKHITGAKEAKCPQVGKYVGKSIWQIVGKTGR